MQIHEVQRTDPLHYNHAWSLRVSFRSSTLIRLVRLNDSNRRNNDTRSRFSYGRWGRGRRPPASSQVFLLPHFDNPWLYGITHNENTDAVVGNARIIQARNNAPDVRDYDTEFGGPEERNRLEQKLLRKIDARMSILVVIYILNYVSFPAKLRIELSVSRRAIR